MKYYSRNGQMGETKPSNNALYKTYTNVAYLVMGVGLHPVAISYLEGWIEKISTIPG